MIKVKMLLSVTCRESGVNIGASGVVSCGYN